ncbi:MAG: 16S rRNA (guanine(966)-N(2))-methyltransferase RsmD [Bryobacteraceae bacterium]
MRVIAGEFRSRRLKTLAGMALRPTPDRLREALFNVLAPRIEGEVFLDAYAGTGSVGIEALSRGASHAIFIEKHAGAVKVIQENLASLGLQRRATVLHSPAAPLVSRRPAGIVFLDPPYPLEQEYTAALESLGEMAAPPALVLVQHASRVDMPLANGRLYRTRVLITGDNSISFFVPTSGTL